MSKRKSLVIVAAGAVVVGVLTLRAVTVHSVGSAPLIYRVTTNNNDLDSVEGLAPPGRLVELWYKQRNFREGTEAGGRTRSPGAQWKNNGARSSSARHGRTRAASGASPTCARPRRSCSFRPPAGDDTCQGGL